jgi:hypothetical protein
MLEFVRWNDEAIAYDNLRMRIAIGIQFVDIKRA